MKHSLVRDTIIATASELFYQNGYNLTGINEIIKEAGIAKATLYSHFKSKEDICVAYLKDMNGKFLEEIEGYAQKQKKGGEQLLALFDFLIKFYHTKHFNGCWCINTVGEVPKDDQKIRPVIKTEKNKFFLMIVRLVENNFEEKSEEESKFLSRQIYLLYEGAISESFLLQDSWPIKSARKICEKLL